MSTRWQLTRAGAGAILIAALMITAGLMKTINLLILLGDLLLVLVALNAIIAWRTSRGVRAAAGDNPDHYAGAATARLLAAVNESASARSVELREESPVHDWSGFAPGLLPGGSTMVRTTLTFPDRGLFRASHSVVCGYPFGFVTVERRSPDTSKLVVLPALGHVDVEQFRHWLRRGGAGDVRSRRPVARHSPNRADLRGVRAFRSGDAPSHIHWRTTARRNELMVREYDSPEALDLLLVVEPWLPASPGEKDLARLEASLSLAATLINAWCRGETSPRIALVLPGKSGEDGRAGPKLGLRMLRRLAAIHGAPDFDWTVTPPLAAARRAARLLVSSRKVPGPLPALLQSRAGGNWRRLTPKSTPTWYHPPQVAT